MLCYNATFGDGQKKGGGGWVVDKEIIISCSLLNLTIPLKQIKH